MDLFTVLRKKFWNLFHYGIKPYFPKNVAYVLKIGKCGKISFTIAIFDQI